LRGLLNLYRLQSLPFSCEKAGRILAPQAVRAAMEESGFSKTGCVLVP
jgi:hypothetical protein